MQKINKRNQTRFVAKFQINTGGGWRQFVKKQLCRRRNFQII